MKPESLSKSLEFLVEAFLEWVRCLRSPIKTARTILSEARDDLDAIRQAMKLWIVAFVLGALLQAGVYRLHGITLSDVSFYLNTGMLLLLMLFAFVLALHFGFRVFGLRAPFRDTFVVYTVLLAALSPFLAILSLPSSFRLLGVLSTLKQEKPELGQGLERYFELMGTQGDSLLGVLAALSSVVISIFYFWVAAVVFSELAMRWDIERARLFNAGSFGMVIFGLLPSTPIAAIQAITLYSFL